MSNLEKYKNARTTFQSVCKVGTIKTKTEESKIVELFKGLDDAHEREAMVTAHKSLHDYIEPFFKKIVELGGPAAIGKGGGVSYVTPIATFKTAVNKIASDYLQAIPPARQRANALHN